MSNWKIVEKDGNPKEQGVYYVIVISGDEAEMTSRLFADVDENPMTADWAMENQPAHGLVWFEQTGSSFGEYVYAWMEPDKIELPELPEGIKLYTGRMGGKKMLKNEREYAICDKFSVLDENLHAHCYECPLNLREKLGGEIGCKATHHYDRSLREWVPDEFTEDETDG